MHAATFVTLLATIFINGSDSQRAEIDKERRRLIEIQSNAFRTYDETGQVSQEAVNTHNFIYKRDLTVATLTAQYEGYKAKLQAAAEELVAARQKEQKGKQAASIETNNN